MQLTGCTKKKVKKAKMQITNFFFKAYKLILSPLLGTNCRFHPSCSEYAKDALDKHGALKGSWLAFKRIIRCNPFGGSGIDEVPK